MPRPALILGVLFALPFVAGPAAMVLGGPTVKLNAYLYLSYYAALGLAFLGAIPYGIVMVRGAADGEWRYWASAVPFIAAGLAIALVHPTLKYLVLLVGYFGVFMLDLNAVKAGLAPGWYKALRKPITIVVLISCGIVIGLVS